MAEYDQYRCSCCPNQYGCGHPYGCMYGYPGAMTSTCYQGFSEGYIMSIQKSQRKECATHPEIRKLKCENCRVSELCHFENRGEIIWEEKSPAEIEDTIVTEERNKIADAHNNEVVQKITVIKLTEKDENLVVFTYPDGATFSFKVEGTWLKKGDSPIWNMKRQARS